MDQIIAKYGKQPLTEEIKGLLLGRTEHDSVNTVVTKCELPTTVDEFRTEFVGLCGKLLPNCVLMPGAARLVRHFYSHRVPIAVATSSSVQGMEAKTVNHRAVFDLFHHIVMGSSDPEVVHGKPAPDVFLVCCSRFPDRPPPEKCLVFEDAPAGVTGARAAGMQTVMVPDKRLDPAQTTHSTHVLKSLLNFVPEEFGLPPFCQCTG